MTESCDLCANAALEQVYAPQGSVRNLTVWLCTHCGLVQSLPRIDRAPRAKAAVSADADWGNLRYGKGFRAEANLAALKPFLPRSERFRVLDVGANRGAFSLELKAAFPAAEIVGLEPDERVVGAWANQPGFNWVNARLEETKPERESFDVIYSCHTLEHVKSARVALQHHWESLKPTGHMLIEVPNLSLLGADDIVEEFFIDKHLYHFSARTLARLLASTGFRAVSVVDPRDNVNITVVATKTQAPNTPIDSDPREVDSATALISGYTATRMQNIAALARVARIINSMAPRKVAIWGAGRLLNSLIQNGGLKADALTAVVDKHLVRYQDEAHGVKISAPADLTKLKPDVVVVMSRSFAKEIRDEAQERVPGCEVIAYADLLAQAKAQAA